MIAVVIEYIRISSNHGENLSDLHLYATALGPHENKQIDSIRYRCSSRKWNTSNFYHTVTSSLAFLLCLLHLEHRTYPRLFSI
jgi:hypothetical protein